MNTVQLLIVCGSALAAIAMVLVWSVERDIFYEPEDEIAPDKATIVINTVDQRALRGVVLKTAKQYIELGEATYMQDTGTTTMTGVVRVPRTNVAFLQDVTTTRTHADTAD